MPESVTKRCTKCGETKPLSEFNRDARAADGHRSDCTECVHERQRLYRQANADAVREEQRNYREANRDELRRKRGLRYLANRDAIIAHTRQYRQENPEKVADQQRRYRESHRDEQAERDRRYREEHPDEIRDRKRRHYAANRDAVTEKVRQYAGENRRQVFEHYGTACVCCGSTEDLTLDHVNGDGAAHREELFGDPQTGGSSFYLWLVKNDFPAEPPLQVLCRPCNISKFQGDHCRLDHSA